MLAGPSKQSGIKGWGWVGGIKLQSLIFNTSTSLKTNTATNTFKPNQYTCRRQDDDKVSVGKFTVVKMTVVKMTVDKMTVDKMTVDKMTVDKMT
jgi:hypothetical protein